MSNNTTDYGEPWEVIDHRLVYFPFVRTRNDLAPSRSDSQRAVACVNDCAGIADPAEALRLAREALSAMLAWTDGVAGDNQNPAAAAAQELAAFNLAKQALSALTPNKPE